MKRSLAAVITMLLGVSLATAQNNPAPEDKPVHSSATKPTKIHKADAGSKDAHKTAKTKKGHKGGKKGTATTEVKPGGPGVPPPTRPPSNPQ